MMGFYVKEKMGRRIIDTPDIYENMNIRILFLVTLLNLPGAIV